MEGGSPLITISNITIYIFSRGVRHWTAFPGFIVAYISGSQVRKKAWEINTTARATGKGAVERDDWREAKYKSVSCYLLILFKVTVWRPLRIQ
jgi:hypothetical protein